MRVCTCDICGKKVGVFELYELVDNYKSELINEACNSCIDDINKYSNTLTIALSKLKTRKVKDRVQSLHNKRMGKV